MTPSRCETCANVREIHTARSRFLLCELSRTNAAFAKYPRQPVVQCEGYRPRTDDPGGAGGDRTPKA